MSKSPASFESDAAGSQATRQRLLDAAELIFARKGYSAASVRQITAEADANLASVNYHFGSKHKLYEQVFEQRLSEMREMRTDAVQAVLAEAEKRSDVEMVIRAFAKAFVQPLNEERHAHTLLQLFMLEMVDPHLPPGLIVERIMKPMQTMMCDAMQRTSPGLSQDAAARCYLSLVGQLSHIAQMAELMRKMKMSTPETLDAQLKHVVHFTAVGVKALADGQ